MSPPAPIPLREDTLASLTRVSTPVYDRTLLTPHILHIGIGNFTRAHQGYYLHKLNTQRAQEPSASLWGIRGASVLPPDAVSAAMINQHCLYTLVEQSASCTTASIIGSYVGFVPPAQSDELQKALAHPDVKIVSLTITEGGYYLADGRFDAAHPDVVTDAQRLREAHTPHTTFGHLVAALRARRDAGLQPFTVMSCDNVPHNGRVARAATSGLAALVDGQLADWIRNHVAFPNSMVDRITPATREDQKRFLKDEYGVVDEAPVFCEDFVQWILEDDFPSGRPAWQDVGVQFVTDVSPFEQMKIRILNGGHATIGYPAALLDITYGHDAMSHEVIHRFLQMVTEEIIPTVPHVPGVDLHAYARRVADRFANPALNDTVSRLCLDGSNRQPKFIIPTIRDQLSEGGDVYGLALVCALWCRYCYGVSESGKKIERNDDRWDELQQLAIRARDTPLVWIRQPLYSKVSSHPRFEEAFCGWLLQIWRESVLSALNSYIDQ